MLLSDSCLHFTYKHNILYYYIMELEFSYNNHIMWRLLVVSLLLNRDNKDYGGYYMLHQSIVTEGYGCQTVNIILSCSRLHGLSSCGCQGILYYLVTITIARIKGLNQVYIYRLVIHTLPSP